MRRVLVAFCVLTCWGHAGCNTDPVWDHPQKVEGATTSVHSPEGIDLPDINIADAREVDLVEQVLTHRALYHRSLNELHDYYRDRGVETKRRWAEKELADVDRIKPFSYIYSGEIASDALRPTDSIPDADAMLVQGIGLLHDGGHDLPAVYRKEKMREALAVFRDLIETYPTSDKIDEAAFYCGEIHKEYFKGEEMIAVRWYERAVQWNPNILLPARFQAAAVYDLRLHDRDRALELYRGVIEHEQFNKSNVSFAMRRIEQLTKLREPKSQAAAITGGAS